MINQKLIIPGGNSSSTNVGYTYYTVKKGDSLYSISRINNTTIEEIINLNSLKNNILSIGQKLKIPSKTIDNSSSNLFNTYVVKNGDSLYSIAKKNNITIIELKNINNITNNTLEVGTMLYIPKTTTILECIGTNYADPTYTTYTVKKGDSLYVIANKYGVSVDSIKSLNNLSSNLLNIGQILKIKEVN